MAYLSFTQFTSLPRCHSSWEVSLKVKFVQVHHIGLKGKWTTRALSKKKITEALSQEISDGEAVIEEKVARRTTKRATARRRKKEMPQDPANGSTSIMDGDVTDGETTISLASYDSSRKGRRRTKKKAESISDSLEEVAVVKKVASRRRTKKLIDNAETLGSSLECSDQEGNQYIGNTEDDSEEELEIQIDEGDDISNTYAWPPLICCFGAAQHAFVPSGSPANRTIDDEMHERRKDAMWTPKKFIRAPGGCSSNVAVAAARLGSKVAFMGKLGDDDFGQSLLYYLNKNDVQTRSIKIDGKQVTAASRMKVSKRGGLRMTDVKSCAEDSLSKSQINVDVLKEAKMFYFNSFSLLGKKMRSTTLEAIKVSKKLGGVVFYDLNLPLPLWHSGEETKLFIQQAWDLSDIIELTSQELEFLCGIKAAEQIDSVDKDSPKFTHHSAEVVASLWHENLKVLFVTNGTSDIHYYTREHNGAVLGMEDGPLTPFTAEMSASGDGVVAGLLKMLTVQPHLMTDKDYLEHSIRYAMNCGVIDQWLYAQLLGFPPKEGMEDDVIPDCNGIKSVTEKEYRTVPLFS